MDIKGSYTFTAPLDSVWSVLQDPVTFAAAMPDCSDLQWVHENRFAGTLHIHAGIFQSKIMGTVTTIPLDTPYSLALQATAHSSEGDLSGSGRLWLESQEEGTVLTYTGEVSVTGQFAEVGTPYLQTISHSILRQNLTEIERQLHHSQQTERETAVPLPSRHTAIRVPGLLSIIGILSLGGLFLLRKLYRLWLRHLARQVAAIIQEQP